MKTKTLFQWHVWLGVATGLLMLIIGTSGAVAVFIEEIDWLATPALRVTPSSNSGQRADVDAVLAAVKAAYPDGRLGGLKVSDRPSFAHVARVQVKGRGSLDVFVNPDSGVIQGDRVVTSSYTSTLRNFIRQLHLRLFMGLWGRVFVGVFGVTLVLSCITGLWIYRGWIKNLFRLRWNAAGARTRWSDLHKLVGVWSLLFNVVIGVTGAVFGLENLTGQIRSKWLRPAAEARAAGTRATPSAPSVPPVETRLSVEALLEKARGAFPDLTVTSITFPTSPTAPVVFRGSVPHPLVQQSHVRSANSISIDPYTGGVRQKVDGRDATGWSRLYSSFDPLHFGYFGGMVTKVIWFILGLAPGVLSLSGAWLWWKRTRGKVRPPAAAKEKATVAAAPRRWLRPVLWSGAGVALGGAYVLVSLSQGTWAVTDKHIEHGLAKPLALALVAFPVTGALGYVLWRSSRFGRYAFAAGAGLSAVWYLTLVTLFQ